MNRSWRGLTKRSTELLNIVFQSRAVTPTPLDLPSLSPPPLFAHKTIKSHPRCLLHHQLIISWGNHTEKKMYNKEESEESLCLRKIIVRSDDL